MCTVEIIHDVPPLSQRGEFIEELGTQVAKMFAYLVDAIILFYLGAGICTAHVTKGADVSNVIPKRFAREPARWDTSASKYFKEDEWRTKFIDI